MKKYLFSLGFLLSCSIADSCGGTAQPVYNCIAGEPVDVVCAPNQRVVSQGFVCVCGDCNLGFNKTICQFDATCR